MSVKLFVGGLSFSTSSDRLREAFARFGNVVAATVMNDRETGRSRGFGFVEMDTTEEAEKAISSLNGSSLDGRMIRVDKATPRGSGPVRTGPPPRRPMGDRGPGGPPRSAGGGFAPRPAEPWAPGGGGGLDSKGGGPGGARRGRTGAQGPRGGGPARRGDWKGGERKPGSGRPKGRRMEDRGGRGDDSGYRWR
jgi:hypothetical protein